MGWRDLVVGVAVAAATGALALVSMGCGPLGKPIDAEVSANYFYGRAGQGVIFCRQGNWLKLGHSYVEGADRRTFRPVASHVAVDERQVYFQAIAQPHIDRETFEVVGRVLRDAEHVYFKGHGEDLLATVAGADVESFEYLFPEDVNPLMWARDAHRYYTNHAPIDVDVESFRFLNYGFVADRYEIYQRNAQLRPVSAVSGPIEVINDFHLRMGTRILSGGVWAPKVLDFEAIEELREINKYVMVINGEVYSQGARVGDGVDAASLAAFPGNQTYARDDENVYFIFTGIERIEGADRATFEPMEGYGSYARDAQRVYYHKKVLEDADRESFEIMFDEEQSYARDKHGRFFMGFRQ